LSHGNKFPMLELISMKYICTNIFCKRVSDSRDSACEPTHIPRLEKQKINNRSVSPTNRRDGERFKTRSKVSRHGRNTQTQWIGMHAKQDKKDYEQKERTHSTSQVTKTQPLILTTDVPFVAALETIPADDWCRTWVAGRTI
jgi:hypothetical protein